MKSSSLLNAAILSVIAEMGHTDMIVVGDCGLPIPDETRRIDIALKKGTPEFLETLDMVLGELNVERSVIASELKEASPWMFSQIETRFAAELIQEVPHEQLKQMLAKAKAVIRTGECTSYANIILVAGPVF